MALPAAGIEIVAGLTGCGRAPADSRTEEYSHQLAKVYI